MSRTVKGVYRNGHVELLEKPQKVGEVEVVVTFPDGTELSGEATRMSPATRLAAWITEDTNTGPGDWELLKAELDRDRLSARKLFPK